jgi:hypothetical protein
MKLTHVGRFAGALAAGGGLAAGFVGLSGQAGASYGPGAQYEIEISANTEGSLGSGIGAGIWLWFALTPTSPTSGTVNYSGATCEHHLIGPTAGAEGDHGATTYTIATTKIVIGPVSLAGGAFSTVLVTVPASYGHYTDTNVSQVFSTFPPLPGTIQVQVAR